MTIDYTNVHQAGYDKSMSIKPGSSRPTKFTTSTSRCLRNHTKECLQKGIFPTIEGSAAYLGVRVRNGWLEKWVVFRTTDWTTELDYPEYTAKEIGKFLQM